MAGDSPRTRSGTRLLPFCKCATARCGLELPVASTEENSDFAARYNLTDEPIEGISKKQATEATNEFLATKQLPSNIRLVRDHTAPWDTKTTARGTILVNVAQISTPEQVPQTILRGGLPNIWYQPNIQKAWQYVRDNLTAEELSAELERRQAQGLRTDPATVREEAAIARVMNSDGDRVARNFHNAIRTALKERFDFNLPASARAQLKNAAIQFLRNRTVLPSTPTSNRALIPMAAVSRGQWGEARLDQVLGGRAKKPSKGFKTDLGIRFVDRFLHEIAHESKAGLDMKLSSKMRTQVLKDAELIRAGKIHGAHWHFFQGAHPDTLKFLEQNGIHYTVY